MRGVYARRPLSPGHVISRDDVYLAVPLLHGQLSCRELRFGEVVLRPIDRHAPVSLREVHGPASDDLGLQRQVETRGSPPLPPEDMVRVA